MSNYMESEEIKRAVKHFKIIRKRRIGVISDYYDLAISALEKQIPVKLTLRNSSVRECPKCHKAYNCKTIYSYIEYCSRCGQKLNINSVR